MNLHDLLNEIEAEFGALVARFRAHPAVQAVATPAPQPAAAAPVAPEVQPATVVFDGTKYATVAERQAAAQALLQSLVAKWGNYNTKIVGPHGYELDPSGAEVMPPAPAVDTSGDRLDFNVMQDGVPIPLPKTIINCPPRVLVRVFYDKSSGASTYADFTTTINGVATPCMTTEVNQIFADSVNGEVSVSVDKPGQQFQIQAA